MSSKPEDSGAGGARPRRVVTPPTWSRPPIALIAQQSEVLLELERRLRASAPLVRFPSLSHFCTERARKDRWSGIVVARACAWDARLDGYVTARDRIALVGLGLERDWPEGVARLVSEGELELWLREPAVRGEPRRDRPDEAPREQAVAPGKFLVVGGAPETAPGLVAQLRRVREVQRVPSAADVPHAFRTGDACTGVVALGSLDPSIVELARHPTTVAVFEPTDASRIAEPLRALDDAASLRGYLAYVVAFEHTGSLAVAAAIERAAQEHDLAVTQAELLAVLLRTEQNDERAALLGVRGSALSGLVRELTTRARGVRLADLLRRVDPAGVPLALPPWAPRGSARPTGVERWERLRERAGSEWHEVPLLALSPIAQERSLLGAARAAQIRTVGALLALPRERVPIDWHQNARALRALDEQLQTAPPREATRPERATTLLGQLETLVARLPASLAAVAHGAIGLGDDAPTPRELARRHGLTRPQLAGQIEAIALRLALFEDDLRGPLERYASARSGHESLGAEQFDPYFRGTGARPGALAFAAWLCGVSLVADDDVARVSKRPSSDTPLPWLEERAVAQEPAEPEDTGLSPELARDIAACLARDQTDTPPAWHTLAALLPEAVARLSPEEVSMPMRLRTFARRAGAGTLGELFGHAELPEQGISFSLVRDTAASLSGWFGASSELRELFATGTLLEAFERRIAALAPAAREIVAARAGLRGEPRDVRELAAARKSTQGAIRQAEKRAMETAISNGWGEAMRARIERGWRDVWSVEGLAREDWFRGVDEGPARHALYYLCEWVFDAAHRPRPSLLDGLEYVTTHEPAEVARLYRQVIAALRTLSGPPRAEVVREAVARLVADPELARQFLDRLRHGARS